MLVTPDKLLLRDVVSAMSMSSLLPPNKKGGGSLYNSERTPLSTKRRAFLKKKGNLSELVLFSSSVILHCLFGIFLLLCFFVVRINAPTRASDGRWMACHENAREAEERDQEFAGDDNSLWLLKQKNSVNNVPTGGTTLPVFLRPFYFF